MQDLRIYRRSQTTRRADLSQRLLDRKEGKKRRRDAGYHFTRASINIPFTLINGRPIRHVRRQGALVPSALLSLCCPFSLSPWTRVSSHLSSFSHHPCCLLHSLLPTHRSPTAPACTHPLLTTDAHRVSSSMQSTDVVDGSIGAPSARTPFAQTPHQ